MPDPQPPFESPLSRRSLLAAGLAGVATTTLVRGDEPSSPVRRVLRLAHLTDAHVQPQRGAAEGLAACLAHAQSQRPAPDLILFGGDNVMNVDGGGRDTAPQQLEVWRSSLRDHCSTPYRTLIGNHDILRLDPRDGKAWAMDAFGLDNRYQTFEQAGWRFILLDSTSPEAGGYKGRLDDEQFDWLERTLRDTPRSTPICVVSHIPILAACAYFDGNNEESGDWRVPGAWMHIDARRIKDLFRRHPNVRLCLSGHIHLADVVNYLGVTYACNGAVSGAWWGGSYQEFAPGYAVVDLFDDGSSAVEFITYGWTTRD